MSKWTRVQKIALGLFMLAGAIYMITEPDDGYILTAFILSISLIMYGAKLLFHYATMSRYMVGGRKILFLSIIFLDAGAFTMSVSDMHHIYVMMYLLGIHAISGVVDILRSAESKRNNSPAWKMSAVKGTVNIGIAAASVVFLNSDMMLVYIYCAGLIYSAVMNIIMATRKTAIVYVQ